MIIFKVTFHVPLFMGMIMIITGSPIWKSTLDKPIKEIQLLNLTKDNDVLELNQLKYGGNRIIDSEILQPTENEVQTEKDNNNIIGNEYPHKSIKDVTSLLRRNISAFEMAHYIFLTGDELGVAMGVETLIREELMTREAAIKFLKDIRMGLEYLKNSYSETKFIDSMKEKLMEETKQSLQTTISPRTTILPYLSTETTHEYINNVTPSPPQIKNNNQKKDENAIDPTELNNAKLSLTDFLYAEYALEEVIYQLAKVMFAQSLNKRSEQAQDALQRLIEFLETEGNNGRISKQLQKKILDVLLTALSDTLIENPELVQKAKAELGNSIYDIQKRYIKNKV